MAGEDQTEGQKEVVDLSTMDRYLGEKPLVDGDRKQRNFLMRPPIEVVSARGIRKKNKNKYHASEIELIADFPNISRGTGRLVLVVAGPKGVEHAHRIPILVGIYSDVLKIEDDYKDLIQRIRTAHYLEEPLKIKVAKD